jgi:hypothetical protein
LEPILNLLVSPDNSLFSGSIPNYRSDAFLLVFEKIFRYGGNSPECAFKMSGESETMLIGYFRDSGFPESSPLLVWVEPGYTCENTF